MPPSNHNQGLTSSPVASINPPKSLLSLPKELLTEVCSYLDQKTAIALLYVDRALHPSAESRIYRDINLFIPTYWGEPVLHRPADLTYGSNAYCNWAGKQARVVEEAGRAEARRRAENMIKVLSRGDDRWRYVRKVVIEPRAGANSAIVQILSLAREYITDIVIIASRKHIYRESWQPSEAQRIWPKLLELQVDGACRFPKLSLLKVKLEEYDCASLPLVLIYMGPNLQHLDLSGGDPEFMMSPSHDEACPCAISPPSDQTLKLSKFTYRGDLTESGYATQLLEWVPRHAHVEDLTLEIDYLHDEGLEEDSRWMRLFLRDRHVKRLDWRLGDKTLDAMLQEDRLYESEADLDSEHDEEADDDRTDNADCREDFGIATLIQNAPKVKHASHERLDYVSLSIDKRLAKVTSLGYRTRHYGRRSTASMCPTKDTTPFRDDIFQAIAIPEEVSHKLLALSRLETVQFFGQSDRLARFVEPCRWQAKGISGVVIRSIHYKDSVLLHIRTYSRSGTTLPDSNDPTKPKHYKLPVAQWEDATDFDGHVVPLWVISIMKQVQGSKEPWTGRGIRVDKRAWQVLLDWKKEAFPVQEEVAVKEKSTSDSPVDVTEIKNSLGSDDDEDKEDPRHDVDE